MAALPRMEHVDVPVVPKGGPRHLKEPRLNLCMELICLCGLRLSVAGIGRNRGRALRGSTVGRARKVEALAFVVNS